MATSALDVTEEEVNYSRFSIGVLKVTPQVLRLVFNTQHPDLKTFLAQNKSKCQQLRNSHVLTKDQWDLLYPATGTVALCDFDTTLIITLLRNLSNITTPASGWNKDPLPSDTSLGADLLRLRRIRNEHAHSKDMRMSNKDFGKKWSDLTMILTRLGGMQIQDEMTFYLSRSLEDTDGGRTIKKEIDLLRNELKMSIPDKIKERGRKLREKAQSSRFVKTKAYKHALKLLNEENILTITGTIGSGKKTLASQLALHFSRNNYTIIPIYDCDEFFECCMKEENLILIVNDPFGTSNLDATAFSKWSKYHDDIYYHLENHTRLKIIFTCRLSLFKNHRCKSSFEIWYRNFINISDGKYCLTYGEKLSLLSVYDQFVILKELSDKIPRVLSNPSFPLLCKISGIKNLEHFSKTALDVYVEEIQNLSNTNAIHYLMLLLVLAEENHLVRDSNHEHVINEITHIFKLQRCPISPRLLDVYLDELEGSFLKETGGIYSFSNDAIYDILAYNAAFTSKCFAIRVCSRIFFTNNVTFKKNLRHSSRLTILLDESNFDAWFNRLQSEIRKGYFFDIIFSEMFSEKKLKRLLIEKVDRLPTPELMKILNGTENDIQFLDNVPSNICCVLREFPLRTKLNFLCGVIIAGHNDLVSVIWKHVKKSKPYDEFDKDDLLKAAVIGGNVKTLKRVIKLWKRKNDFLPFVDRKQRRFYKNQLEGCSPVCVSSACNRLELIQFLKGLTFDMNERSGDGDTPLAYAARFGNEDVARFLLSLTETYINTQNKDGKTPLMWAVENEAIFHILLQKGADFRLLTDENENVLMMACELGKVTIVEDILQTAHEKLSFRKRVSFINQWKINGITALHKACDCKEKESRLPIAHMLLMGNAEPHPFNEFQVSSFLHLASAHNDHRLMNLLLSEKIEDVNCVDIDGVTPVFIAAENNFPRLVSLLLDNEADPYKYRWTDRATPLLISAERGHLEVVRILLQTLGQGIGIDFVNFQNSTPLLLATLNNHTNVCELLLDYGADVNAKNENGYDPILVASRNGNTKLIHLYLQKGANVNSQSVSDQNTPLHFAAMMGNKRASKYLLAKGAYPEMKNKEGLTPSVVAIYRKQNEIADLLFRFRMFGLHSVEFQTPSVESPYTPTSVFSSEPSSHQSPFPTSVNAGAVFANQKRFYLVKAPSRTSIASGSESSFVYSDKGSRHSLNASTKRVGLVRTTSSRSIASAPSCCIESRKKGSRLSRFFKTGSQAESKNRRGFVRESSRLSL